MNKELERITKWADEIAGSWNGDESGRGEDRAMQAQDIIEACKTLQELLDNMDNL